jgi:hypothetical protein
MISADGTASANAVKPRKSQHAAVVFRSWNASNSRSLAAAYSWIPKCCAWSPSCCEKSAGGVKYGR